MLGHKIVDQLLEGWGKYHARQRPRGRGDYAPLLERAFHGEEKMGERLPHFGPQKNSPQRVNLPLPIFRPRSVTGLPSIEDGAEEVRRDVALGDHAAMPAGGEGR